VPRKGGESYKPWRVGGVPLGHVRSGIFWISRTVHGRRYRVSTGCRTPEAALSEYQRFEKDPARYVPRGATGAGWDAAVPGFLRYSESVVLNSARWVEKQEAYLANFGAFVRGGHRVFQSLDAFTASDIRSFIAALTEGAITGRKVGAPSVNRHLAALKGFMGWARKERLTLNAADHEVPLVREDKGVRIPEEIPKDRWRPILAALDERWRCAAEVQLGAGLRYGEVAALRPADIHAHAIHVPKAKGRRGRTVPASARTVAAARKMLALGGVPDDEGSQFNHRLETAAKAAGRPRFTTHALRHTYGTFTLRALLRAGQGLRELQERLGHASIRTTEKYLHAVRAGGGVRVVVGAPI
jgi:integrase/recombinase XerC